MYPTELELKVQYDGSHAPFLDLNISIGKSKFIYKMFDKHDAFNFHIVGMSSITSNIPSSIFYISTMSEFVKIARSTLIIICL